MCDEALEQVLEFSTNPGSASLSNNAISKDCSECNICNSLMLEPYTLQCGHAFCGKCLLSWIRERQDQSTCPQCRSNISSEPILSLGSRQIALAIAQSWNQTGHTPQISEQELELKETPIFFPNGPSSFAVYDEDDGIFRCPHCSHEVENHECTNCGRTFRGMASDRDYTSDAVSSGEDVSDAEDLESFIDDDEEDESQRVLHERRPNFAHMLAGRSNEVVGHYAEDDSFDEFVDDDEDDDDDDDDDDHDDDEDNDDENRVGEDGDDTKNSDYDMETDHSDQNMESDDSSLEETRNRMRSSRTIVDSDSDSDIEVVSVRHRPQVISDDYDDDDD